MGTSFKGKPLRSLKTLITVFDNLAISDSDTLRQLASKLTVETSLGKNLSSNNKRVDSACCKIPIISKIPGFIEYFWVDAGNGVMVSTSVFQTREGEEESNTKVKQWRLRNPEANVALPNPPQITAGKVVGYKAR